MAKTPWALMAERESPWRTLPTRGSQDSGGAAGSTPSCPRQDAAGRSCQPFERLRLLLPGRRRASGTASLLHRTGSPRRSRGGARSPHPQPGVRSQQRDPGGGGASLSKRAAAAAAVAMDTRAAPIGEAFWGRGLPGNHTHLGAGRGHLAAAAGGGGARGLRPWGSDLCGHRRGTSAGLVVLTPSRGHTRVSPQSIWSPRAEPGTWPTVFGESTCWPAFSSSNLVKAPPRRLGPAPPSNRTASSWPPSLPFLPS